MERTSALDSAFLHLDSSTSALHIASLAFFDGPVPTQAEIRAAIVRKLDRAPRCRQRLASVPLSVGRPIWVDDPDFDVARHVLRAAVPRPGGTTELQGVVERLLSEPLDHEAPLWEDWVLEGLADGSWALLTKVHHSMVDGIAGTDLLSTLLDRSPTPEDAPTGPWRAAQPPAGWQLLAGALWENAGLRLSELRALPGAVGHSVAHPRQVAGSAYATARGLLGFTRNLWPTPASSLVGPIGRDRGYDWTDVDLRAVLEIHSRLGGTVNDLVLAAVAGAFRDLLLARGEDPAPHSVRTLIPVSVRRPDQRGAFDNQVSAILLDLPVELADPRERLLEVAVRMRSLKDSHEAQAGEQVTAVADVLPPLPLAAFQHLVFRLPHRNLTTVVTNVPGPTGPLFLAGRPMRATYPYVPIADRVRTGIAVTTYEGRLLFGVTSDRESMPDAHALVTGIACSLTELATLAGVDLEPDAGSARPTTSTERIAQ